jgi:hypothetical protein
LADPEKRDQSESVGPGLIIATMLCIAAFIAFMVYVQNHPGHWLALLSRICSFLIGCWVFLWLVPEGIIKFFRRRAAERRERAERDEGLNGPSRRQ